MKTILLPTDFSETAKKAADYAISLAKELSFNRIVLYNAYQVPVSADPLTPVMQMIDIDTLKDLSTSNMKAFRERITDAEGITIETVTELNGLSDGIDSMVEKFVANLVVMGITGVGKLEETLIGSNAIDVAKNTTVPVIVVPPDAVYKKIENVMLACDLKKIIDTTPVEPIRQLIGATKAKLSVLHVSGTNERFSTETEHEIKMLDGLLQGLNPEFFFVDNDDFMEAINDFTTKNNIDVIITIPKKHGLFEGLFKKSHFKMLGYHSHVPLMVVHE